MKNKIAVIILSAVFVFGLTGNALALKNEGTCECTKSGTPTYNTNSLANIGAGSPGLGAIAIKPKVVSYDFKDLPKPVQFPKVNAEDCANGIFLNQGIHYGDCTFIPDKITATDILSDFKIREPILSLTWPGLNFTKLSSTIFTDASGNRFIQLPWLAEFIKALYNIALGISSIVGVVMIIIEGIKVIMAGTGLGEGDNAAAHYKNIARILVGLALAWSSYLILYQINPNLTKFGVLQVAYVEKIDMPDDYIVPEQDTNGANITVGDSGDASWAIFPANLTNLKNSSGKKARPDLISAFTAAVKNFGKTVTINSAGRTGAEQYGLMIKMCQCPPVKDLTKDHYESKDWKEICKILQQGQICNASPVVKYDKGVFTAPVSGHLAGNAVDIQSGPSKIRCSNLSENESLARDSDGAIKIKEGSAGWCVPKDQQELISAMLNAGFCVGLKDKKSVREAWHFEYVGSGITLSPFCTRDKNDPNLQKLKYLKLNY